MLIISYREALGTLTNCDIVFSDPLRGITAVGADWTGGLQEWSSLL
jgi:hypothetical protein